MAAAARELHAALKRELAQRRADAEVNTGLVAGMRLCEKFVQSRGGDVEGLKKAVADAVRTNGKPKPRAAAAGKTGRATASSFQTTAGKTQAHVTISDALPPITSSPSKLDYTRPINALERDARQLESDYLRMEQKQDAKVREEDAAKLAKIASQGVTRKQALLAQMEEHRAADRAALQAKKDELAATNRAAKTWEEEERQRLLKARNKSYALQRERDAQVKADAEARRQERIALKMEDEQMMRRMQADAQKEERVMSAKRKEKERQHLEATAENQRRKAEKEREKEAAAAEEVRLMREYELEMKRRDERRSFEIEETRRKALAKYHAGGGEALSASLQQKADEDARRAALAARELADREDEKARKREEHRKQTELAQRRALDAQIALHEQQRAAEREAAERYAAQVTAELEAIEEEKRRAKEALKKQKQANLADRRKELEEEARRRFDAARELMPAQERKMQKAFLS